MTQLHCKAIPHTPFRTHLRALQRSEKSIATLFELKHLKGSLERLLEQKRSAEQLNIKH